MNTDKKVFNKLFESEKVELESQRIELGAVEEIRAQLEKAGSLMDIQSEIIAAENKLKSAQKIYDEAKARSFKTWQQLMALGISGDIVKSVEKLNKEAEQGVKSTQTIMAYIRKVI